jgi:transposase
MDSALVGLAGKINSILPMLDEKQRRVYLASEAKALGHGGVKIIHEISGVSQTTIIRGKKELDAGEAEDDNRVRAKGGGRKKTTQKYECISEEIQKIIGEETYGNPENPLSWTTKSLRNITDALQKSGYEVGHDTVGKIMKELGYSLQQNQKMLQIGESHPDRNEQFEFINKKSGMFISKGFPVISVDAKKKESVGNFKNNGAEYSQKKNPTKVLDHDFPVKELGKVAPYGVYDINRNEGFVNLGISHDTAEFAVESILRWWQTLGKNTYPMAKKIYILGDSGGSNGSRNRMWKKQLQEFANISRLTVHVSHFPPGTSKWNKIEHRMFCFISKNWRGKPLISIEAIINLISNTVTNKGLRIICKKDDNTYELGQKVSDQDLDSINIYNYAKLGSWNYRISPAK